MLKLINSIRSSKLQITKDFYMLTIVGNAYILGDSLIHIFGIVFFYLKFGNPFLAILPLAFRHFLQASFVLIIRNFLGRIGTRKSMMIGLLLFCFSSGALYLFGVTESIAALSLWVILNAGAKAFYHVPMTYSLGKQMAHSQRGQLYSFFRISAIVSSVLAPLLGGLISEKYQLAGLALASTVVFLVGIVPTLSVADVKFKVSLDLKKYFSSKRGNKLVKILMFYEFATTLNNFWPLFIFLTIGSTFSGVGIILTIVYIARAISAYVVGKKLDKGSGDRQRVFKLGVIFIPIAWLVRMTSFNFITVLAADIVSQLNYEIGSNAKQTYMYDLLNDDVTEEFKDELVIANEVIANYLLSLGFVIAGAIVAILGFKAGFLWSAIVSALILTV